MYAYEAYEYSDLTLQIAFGCLIDVLKRGGKRASFHPLEEKYLLELASILGQQELICDAAEKGPLGGFPEGVDLRAMFLYPRLKAFFEREEGSLRETSRLVVQFSKSRVMRKKDRKMLLGVMERLMSEFWDYSIYNDDSNGFLRVS